MFEILQYSFFQKAILGGVLISLISSVLGVFIVMRKEANVNHSIANFLFLGIALSLLFHGNYYFFAFVFGIIGSLLIFFIEKTNLVTRESTKEIIAQIGIAGGIFVISFLGNLNLDIKNFLFGSILFISRSDIFILSVLLIILLITFFFFSRRFLSVIIHEDLAKSKGIQVDLYNGVFLVFLGIFIAISIKIFGILLVGAFLVLPANTAKILSPNLKYCFIISCTLSCIAIVSGLFLSYFLGSSSGATVVLILVVFFIVSLFMKRK